MVCELMRAGIADGVKTGEFLPEAKPTREEAAKFGWNTCDIWEEKNRGGKSWIMGIRRSLHGGREQMEPGRMDGDGENALPHGELARKRSLRQYAGFYPG